MELFLGYPDNLEIISVRMHLINGILVDGNKAFCLKNIGNNEVSTNESLEPNLAISYIRYFGNCTNVITHRGLIFLVNSDSLLSWKVTLRDTHPK